MHAARSWHYRRRCGADLKFACWSCFILSITNLLISLMNIIARIALTQHLSFLMANVMLYAHIAYCTLSTVNTE